MGKDEGVKGRPEESNYPTEIIPSLQDVREATLSKVEKQYLEDLMLVTKKDINEDWATWPALLAGKRQDQRAAAPVTHGPCESSAGKATSKVGPELLLDVRG